ncbi:MAG TPA: hypothetical protein P5250_01065 [Bacteroidales bacterium]|nr:hypothetical protein [Bacteroidales bacterium]
MKKFDFLVLFCVVVVFIPFFTSNEIYNFYVTFNKDYPLIISFIKFAILATFGEALGLRIKTGQYNQKGFGLLPRAIVWGFIGITISIAFKIFYVGVPAFLEDIGLSNMSQVMKGPFTFKKLLGAFSISVAINIIYAPVMMTFHKITDTHIINNKGTLKGFFSKVNFEEIICNLNWKVQWNFVFLKTIPFFWIPAHTITFVLPPEYQVLSAALLSIVLGVILAIAAQKSKK